jgi:hypothetical protein
VIGILTIERLTRPSHIRPVEWAVAVPIGLTRLFASRPTPWNSPLGSRQPSLTSSRRNAPRIAARLLVILVTSGAITDTRAGDGPFPETLPVFGRVDDLIDERRGTARRGEHPGVIERFGLGSAVKKMSIDIDHHIVPVLAANPPQMFWRFGDGANDFANRNAPAQMLKPIGRTGIGGTLQDLSIHLFNNLPRICRAWLLSHREGRDDRERADEYG